MIPKKIHYCWFGKGKMPKKALNCIKSWKKYCKDYELVLWDEESFDINSNAYVKEAYENRKFAFVTDYVRLYALYTQGGVYMDTDVEVIKPLDEFLSNKAFSGFESNEYVPTGIMASEKELPIFKELLDYYNDRHFIDKDGNMDITTNVIIITNILKEHGLKCDNKLQTVADFTLYPYDYFCPIDLHTKIKRITNNTATIHWFSGSWLPRRQKIKIEIHNSLERIMGKENLSKAKTVFKMAKYKRLKIDKDLITFTSFNGKYADSPKALTESIHRLDESKKIVWFVNKVDNKDIPSYVHVEKYGTTKAWNLYYRAAKVVDNVYGLHETYLRSNSFADKFKFRLLTYLTNKKGQHVYTTWHGTPLKKMGIDAVNNDIVDFNCSNVTMILDNQYTYDIMKRITLGKINMELLGSPKNDLLFDDKVDVKELKKKLKLPVDRNILLFAPSFRTDSNNEQNISRSGISQIEMMDVDKLLDKMKEAFGGEWSIVCRFHYHVEKKINWSELKERYGDKIINGNEHEDIMEYLKCSDVLFTDMSSCLFDFSLMDKPVFLFFPDLEEYKNNERGLYINIDELPFACSKTFEKLLQDIEKFDLKEYQVKVNKFINSLGYVNREKTADKVAQFILNNGVNNE